MRRRKFWSIFHMDRYVRLTSKALRFLTGNINQSCRVGPKLQFRSIFSVEIRSALKDITILILSPSKSTQQMPRRCSRPPTVTNSICSRCTVRNSSSKISTRKIALTFYNWQSNDYSSRFGIEKFAISYSL